MNAATIRRASRAFRLVVAAVMALTALTVVACHRQQSPSNSGSELPAVKPVPAGPRIPIELAMDLIVQQAEQSAPSASPPTAVSSLKLTPADLQEASEFYSAHCSSCHGAHGHGGVPVKMLAADPYSEVSARSFDAPLDATWQSNESQFSLIVSHGLPGRMMPGVGTLTKSRMKALYGYVLTLGTGAPAGPTGGS
jgi:mono/diheme cytochrome c family protein